jgi:hypothetical protein
MLTKSHLTIATTLAVAALAAPGAMAMPADPAESTSKDLPAYPTPLDPRQADMHASTVQTPRDHGVADARGEHATSMADAPSGADARGEHVASIADARGEHAAATSENRAAADGGGDQRSPDAVEPFVRPVVVETGDPSSPGFDWTSAIIGIAGGLALAVLAGAAVGGGRPRRRARTV